MKRVKKLLSVLLVLTLTFGLIPLLPGGRTNVLAVEEFPSHPFPYTITWGDFTVTITEDTEAAWDLSYGKPCKLEITGSGAMPDIGPTAPWKAYAPFITAISIPEGVTCIGRYNFYECPSVQSVTIPDSVTNIKNLAFGYCSTLKEVNLGTGLKELGPQAFIHCTSLKNITFPDSLETIGLDCFYATGITSITIPKNVSSINARAFGNAFRLSSIQIAAGNTHFKVFDQVLYEIKDGRPYQVVCCALANLGIDRQLEILDGTERIMQYAFDYGGNHIASLILPKTLKRIDSYAFSHCSSIKELRIPDSVETIGTQAFAYCSALTTVSIGKGLQNYSDLVFDNCKALKEINVSEDNAHLSATDHVLYNKERSILYYYASAKPDTAFHVPDTVEKIVNYAICHSPLIELYLPKRLQTLGTNAIFYNKSLKSIFFAGDAPNCPSTPVKTISNNAENLMLYKTNDSNWPVESNAWSSFLFGTWDTQNTSQDSGNISGIDWKYEASMGRLTFTGAGELPDYEDSASTPWGAYRNDIQTIDMEQVSGIGRHTFHQAEKLIRLDADESLKQIGDYAFADCPNLVFSDFEGIETVGEAAFQNDSSFTRLVLYGVSDIGAGAFKGCSALTYASLGGRLKSMPQEVFAGCSALASLIVPESVSSIGPRALQGCSSLYSINIPAAVSSIQSKAFAACAAMKNAYFYGGMPSEWADDSFAECGGLTLCYRTAQAQNGWTSLGPAWNGLPLKGLDKFYTERQDHYSFNNSASSYGYETGYRIPRQRYVDVLDSITQGTYYYATDGTWRGSCYGMASSTLDFYEHPEKLQALGYDAGQIPYKLQAPRDPNKTLTKQIEAYQISQYKTGYGLPGKTEKEHYRNLIQRIEEFERSGGLRIDSNAEPILLCLSSCNSGHAVTPVSVSQKDNGDYAVQVYDPNAPSALQTLTISKDCSAITYQVGPITYKKASYKDYSAISKAMSDVTLHSATHAPDSQLRLAIDKENGIVAAADGRKLENIEGAYEQLQIGAETDDEDFTGIRRFVLPKGDYQLYREEEGQTEDDSLTEDGVTFYLADGDLFAQIAASDENASLDVKEGGADGLELTLQPSSEESESVSCTFTNAQDQTQAVEIVGAHNKTPITFTMANDDMISIKNVPEGADVTVGGEKAQITGGQVSVKLKDATRKVESITLSVDKRSLNAGNTLQLTAAVFPQDAADKSLKWSSSDHLVASVDDNGLVTALSPGEATITVESQDGSGVSASCVISVGSSDTPSGGGNNNPSGGNGSGDNNNPSGGNNNSGDNNNPSGGGNGSGGNNNPSGGNNSSSGSGSGGNNNPSGGNNGSGGSGSGGNNNPSSGGTSSGSNSGSGSNGSSGNNSSSGNNNNPSGGGNNGNPSGGNNSNPSDENGSTNGNAGTDHPSNGNDAPNGSMQIKLLYYVITFDANAGTNLSRDTMTLLSDDNLGILPQVQRKNYIFNGWYTQKVGGSKVSGSTVLNAGATLFAQWKKILKPTQAKLSKLNSKKAGQITVSLKKMAGADGYEIAYSTDKKFPAAATKKAATVSEKKTIKKLKSSKKYYVKARAYTIDSTGKKIYGAYGKAKSVSVK